MSIQLYTGTPGSGKSFHAAKDIVRWMKRDRGLICNFPVNEGFVGKKLRAHVEYWDNSEGRPDAGCDRRMSDYFQLQGLRA